MTSDRPYPAAHERQRVLISGASFAGLATAWWMERLGYAVTVVEIAPGLRKGGTPVDIRDDVIAVVKRMGLLDEIAAAGLPPRTFSYARPDGTIIATMPAQADARPGWEIERDALLDLLYERVRNTVSFRFSDSIAAVEQMPGKVSVQFNSGRHEDFSLLFGCDGTHSAVRRLCFGEESRFLVFLKMYFSLSVVRKELIERNTSQLIHLPDKVVMLNGYEGKTDIGLCFASEREISYSRRDQDAQKQMIAQHFEDEAARVPQLVEEMWRCENFYFDKLCQIRMPSWSSGNVALIGDAGYCPSPAAGLGGSIALLGAAALADAFVEFPRDVSAAFAAYEASLRPTVERIQSEAMGRAQQMFQPVTPEILAQWAAG